MVLYNKLFDASDARTPLVVTLTPRSLISYMYSLPAPDPSYNILSFLAGK